MMKLLPLLSMLLAEAHHAHSHHHHRHDEEKFVRQSPADDTPLLRPTHRHGSHDRSLDDIEHDDCGFDEADAPTPEELAQEMLDQQAWSKLKRKSMRSEISIPTYFHILQYDTDEMISDERVYEYMNYLNDAFATNSRFQFRLQAITRTVNEYWSNNGRTAQHDFKSSLKVGDRETLNIYICNVVPRDATSESTLAGYAYLPTSQIDAVLDGVVLSRTYDGDRQRPNTLVHEVGHYMGLMHTFEGDSCGDIVGDAVEDTPQHRRPSAFLNGCTSEVVDTCEDTAGEDPIANYMTYSNDNECRTEFTPGQVERMEYQYYAHRAVSEEVQFTDRPTMVPEECAPFFGMCDVRDCCFGNCWRGLFFGLLPDFCFL